MSHFFARKLQVLKYGWRDSKAIADEMIVSGRKAFRLSVFFDILKYFCRFHLFSNQYKAERLWEMERAKKIELARRLGDANMRRDKVIQTWQRGYYSNFRFLHKYTSMKYDASRYMIWKRNAAYAKRYNMGQNCLVQYGVTIIAEHFSDAKIHIGDNCLLARNCDLDYTGGLDVGNGVCILEGVKILTHAHDSLHMKKDDRLIKYSNRAYKTPLVIEDNVEICARAIIMPGVGRIGSNSIISAGAIVTKPVPPNSLVGGNPARVMFQLEDDMKLDTGH